MQKLGDVHVKNRTPDGRMAVYMRYANDLDAADKEHDRTTRLCQKVENLNGYFSAADNNLM